jgi:glycerol-3-phosphate dehydrogenase subunit B
MNKKTRRYESDLAVIGAGITGCAASIFALDRGLTTVQIGNSGALAYTSGYFDLLGKLDTHFLDNPWQGLDQLRRQEPDHPYAKISNSDIKNAFVEFINALDEMGLKYTLPSQQNHQVLLPAGVLKPTYCLPSTMQKAIPARANNARVLLVDFIGLQGFSAKEIAANMKSHWPQLRTQFIDFPDMESGVQLYPEVMARALEVPATRNAFADRLKAVAADAEYIALPAILGIHRPDYIHAEMERLVGLPLFEIPTIPPAVPGIRLRELFAQQLARRGAINIAQQKVQRLELHSGAIRLFLQDNYGAIEINTKQVILASGRFLSGGLKTDQHQVQESLMNLPIDQPSDRENWFNKSYFDPQGHAINRAGVMVNEDFHAVDHQGQIIDKRLLAAGILLAHQDWIRQRCGAGLAIASAYKAVNTIKQNLVAA